MIRSATPSEYETTYSLRRWSIIGARSGGAEMVEKEKGEKSRRGGGGGEGGEKEKETIIPCHRLLFFPLFLLLFFFLFFSFFFFFTTEQTIIRIRTALSEITSARSIVFARFKGMKYTAQTKDGPIDENYREGRTIDVP